MGVNIDSLWKNYCSKKCNSKLINCFSDDSFVPCFLDGSFVLTNLIYFHEVGSCKLFMEIKSVVAMAILA
jgi:hypothetical protein